MIQFKKYYTLMCRLKDNIYHVCLWYSSSRRRKRIKKRIVDGGGGRYRYGRGTPVAFNCFIT
jgi:hypothetical protein